MKSAFVRWEEPPPKVTRSSTQYDSALTVLDLLFSVGRWALTEWTGAQSGANFVAWCELRGMKAETVTRQGKIFARLLS